MQYTRPNRFKRNVQSGFGGEVLGFVAFLGMNGREEELVNGTIVVDRMTAFGLTTAHNPISAGFGLRKRVETSG